MLCSQKKSLNWLPDNHYNVNKFHSNNFNTLSNVIKSVFCEGFDRARMVNLHSFAQTTRKFQKFTGASNNIAW